jgi:hypothetical protein
MKILTTAILFTSMSVTCALGQKYPGNNVVQFIQHDKDKDFFYDPIDDTINYKLIVDKIYKGADGKLYLLDKSVSAGKTYLMGQTSSLEIDSVILYEYFHDYSDFIDLKTYRLIAGDYFANNNKVYLWSPNSDGSFPVEVENADFKTFRPFDNVCGGTDKNYVFYGSPQDGIKIIDGANPKTIKVLNPKRGCWNCGNCYFKDDKKIFFSFAIIDNADVKTFKLVNLDKVDCTDKNKKYFDGQAIE